MGHRPGLPGPRPRPAARLAARRLPCELGCWRPEPPAFEGQRRRLGATWRSGGDRGAPVAGGPGARRRGLPVRGRRRHGPRYDVGALASLEGRTEPWEPLVDRVLAEIAVPLVVDGRTAAVVFDCGLGDGAYQVYAGQDSRGRTVAVLADLEIHHQGTAQA
ncbi:MAG: hypothetical protein R2731_07855 [Nocardioides sp.]